MTERDELPALAVNFGGGGGFGFGFNMGVAEGLRRAGIDLTRYPMVGTSAGSHTVAALQLGFDFATFADAWADQIGHGPARPWIDGHAFAERMYVGRHDPDVATVAVRLLRLRREVLRSTEHDIDDIVAASSAAVPVLRPHRVDGRLYADGGLISLNSVDLTPPAQVALAVTPFARPGQGPAGLTGRLQVRRELRRWVRRHRGDLLQVVPTDAMVAIGGRRVRDIVDIGIGRKVHPLAVDYGERVAAELRDMRPDLFP